MKKNRGRLWLVALIALVYALHQDFWNWRNSEPLVFGFLPIGLAYQVGYSILAALLMAVLVRVAWPAHLESIESNEPGRETGKGKGGE